MHNLKLNHVGFLTKKKVQVGYKNRDFNDIFFKWSCFGCNTCYSIKLVYGRKTGPRSTPESLTLTSDFMIFHCSEAREKNGKNHLPGDKRF